MEMVEQDNRLELSAKVHPKLNLILASFFWELSMVMVVVRCHITMHQ